MYTNKISEVTLHSTVGETALHYLKGQADITRLEPFPNKY